VKGEIVGVNNRNLRTLAVDVRASEDLMAGIPAGVVAVSESGLKTTADLQHLRTAGYSAFLIGERFMLADDPEAAVRQLLAGGADAESALNT
jgi:indole-3-glycerol phosphate synthase